MTKPLAASDSLTVLWRACSSCGRPWPFPDHEVKPDVAYEGRCQMCLIASEVALKRELEALKHESITEGLDVWMEDC